MNISNNWRTVWERKGNEVEVATSDLDRLIRANGYDSGCGGFTVAAWTAYVDRVLNRLGANPGQTLFEVGCGAGAFLLPAHERGLTVGGCDYSSTLAAAAARAIPDGHFECCQASELAVLPQYDFVVSSGVFHYFQDLSYAEGVVKAMAEKARHGVAILDIPDIIHREANLRLRYEVAGSKEAHEELYRGLDHLFYERQWVVQAVRNAGLSLVDVSDQNIEGSPSAPARFNVFAWPS